MEKEPQEPEIRVIDPLLMIIPDCCKEGWESCKHVVRKPKPKKSNVGL
jgi:hypothetical protein